MAVAEESVRRMNYLDVQVAKLDERAILPSQAYVGEDAGWDLFALEDTVIPAGEFGDVRSGIALAFPPGWYCRIVNRSSSLRKKGLLIVEGVCDAGYRGEQLACAINTNEYDYMIAARTSIAQLVFTPVPLVVWHELPFFALHGSQRGSKGFGSSG